MSYEMQLRDVKSQFQDSHNWEKNIVIVGYKAAITRNKDAIVGYEIAIARNYVAITINILPIAQLQESQ